MSTPNLYLSYDACLDWLMCFEFGRVDDGAHPDAWQPVSESFAYLLDEPEGWVVGFKALDFVTFDAEAEPTLWEGPRFHCPALGLRDATAGVICMAATVYLDGSTLNRLLFGEAVREQEAEDAAARWRRVIEAGDPMGHFGLGYTLFDMGEVAEAYLHLRTYTVVAPYCAWAWNWRGQAALAIGDPDQARECLERALEVERIEGTETDAAERLAALEWSA